MPIPHIDAILTAGVIPGTDRNESAIGIAWLRQHWQEWDRVEFNRGLGPGVDLGPGVPAYVQASATASTKPKADMIVYRGDHIAGVVELKARISGSALGQVITYAHLLKADNPRLLQIYKYVAGGSIIAGIEGVYDHAGVVVELFPLALPPTSA